MKEANLFLNELEKCCIGKSFELIFNKPDIYKKKILTAHFVIKFENDFYLKVLKQKVLKKHDLYDFTFTRGDVDYFKITFGRSRDIDFGFLSLLCSQHDDLDEGVASYYPVNFEETQYFKDYYVCVDGKDNKKEFGLQVDKAIAYIKNNYDFIKTTIYSA